jgi:hypothetical protein
MCVEGFHTDRFFVVDLHNVPGDFSCRRTLFHAGVYTDAATDGHQDGTLNIIRYVTFKCFSFGE